MLNTGGLKNAYCGMTSLNDLVKRLFENMQQCVEEMPAIETVNATSQKIFTESKNEQNEVMVIKSNFVGIAGLDASIKNKATPVYIDKGVSLGVVEAMKIYNERYVEQLIGEYE